MKRLVSYFLVMISFTAITAGSALASLQVYLKDGAIIDCQKVWQKNGKVMVQVNRDVLLDFSTAEVDMTKTFARKTDPAKAKKKAIRRAVKHAPSKPLGAVQAPVSTAKKAPAAAKPAPAPKKAVAPAPPAVAPKAVQPKPAPATPQAAQPKAPPAAPAVPASPKAAPPAAVALQPAVAKTVAKQNPVSTAKVAAVAKTPVKRPPIKYVAPPPSEPEPFYKNPLFIQAGGGGLLVVLLVVLLVLRKKKA